MALDVTKTIYDRVWAVLLANAGFTGAFREANRVKGQQASLRDQVQAGPGDFPKIRVHVDGPGATKVPKVFGQQSNTFTSATVDYPVEMSVTAAIEVWHDADNMDTNTAAETPILAALMSGGPRFGLDYCSGVDVGRPRREWKKDTSGTRRWCVTTPLTFRLAPYLSTLTG